MIIKILLPIVCGFLGAWGGAEGTSKNWRRVGIPVAIGLALWNPWALTLFMPLIMGYGIPDGPPPLDQGSWLGRFFYYKVTNESQLWAAVLTRMSIGIFTGGILAVLTSNIWPIPILGIIMPLFGAIIKTEPQVKIFGKVLNTEEMIIWGVAGICACL